MRAAGIEPFSKALRNRRADALPNGLWHTKWFKDYSLVEPLGSMSGTRATQKGRKTEKIGKKMTPKKRPYHYDFGKFRILDVRTLKIASLKRQSDY